MNKNSKKLVKMCAIGVGIYALSEFCFLFGKGSMIGIMLANNDTPDKLIERLAEPTNNTRLNMNGKFMRFIAMKVKES